MIRINGDVLFDSASGIDVRPEHRRVGYVFQDALLFPAPRREGEPHSMGNGCAPPSQRVIDEQHVVELLGLRVAATAAGRAR